MGMAFCHLSKQELYERVGHMDQIAGFKRYVLCEGKKNGVHAVDIWNGSGLEMTVVCDRASDISSLRFKGKSLCWLSNLGVSAPEFARQGDFEWNQNFSGGMFATCGLTTAGLPSEDDGERLELHGSVSNLPSEEIGCKTWWDGPPHLSSAEYVVEFESKTRQARPFGEHLCMTRNIRVKMGENTVYVHDCVENLGFRDVPFMLVYHMNFGYPLLDEGSRICLTYDERFPTSELAEKSAGEIGVIGKPDDGYGARAYNHTAAADEDGFAWASLLNEKLGLGATVKFRAEELNQFNLWKCLQKGRYVVGLEPCNCRTWGRDREREAGNLAVIKPYEKRELYFELQIHEGVDEVRSALERYEERYRL